AVASSQRIRRSAVFALLAFFVSAPAFAQVTFNVSFDASADVLTPTEKNNVTSHLRAAGEGWVNHLLIAGPRTIDIRVSIADIPTANGASASTGFVGVLDGRDTYEQGLAYELRTGIDPNDGDQDANIAFGLTYLRNELWFDPDPAARTAPVPANRTDAMSVALHELGHAIAYNGWADLNTGEPPATYWSTFDSWMIPGQPTLFAGPAASDAWGSLPDLTVGNLMHWGNQALRGESPTTARCETNAARWANGAPVPRVCHAPDSADAPFSKDRGDGGPITNGASLIDQLMNGVVFYRGTRYEISALDVGVLRDVGLATDDLFSNGFE
ncbi:MAG: hypothetical protein ACREPX_15875, partial [Rhodanobacteraceae bacterium]